MPTISVIVPVYNVENYMHRCVDSILNQTFTDFELILVDDGSPDNCGAICDEYEKQDNRIAVVHKKNGGPSSARNAGLDIAQGKYIMFCDSDDWVDSRWCEYSYRAICTNEKAWIVTDIHRKSTPDEKGPVDSRFDEISLESKSYFEIYKMGLSPYAYNKIYSREIIEQNNLRFDEACRFAEDVEFNVRYCMLCERCLFLPKKLYVYFQNPDSIMHRHYDNWMELHFPLFTCRFPLIRPEEMAEYCDIWLYQFITWLDVIFDKRSRLSFIQKLNYNHKMLKTDAFQICLKEASGNKESPLVLMLLRTRNYYLYWAVMQIIRLKQKVGGN